MSTVSTSRSVNEKASLAVNDRREVNKRLARTKVKKMSLPLRNDGRPERRLEIGVVAERVVRVACCKYEPLLIAMTLCK